jgi:hypothetical protein
MNPEAIRAKAIEALISVLKADKKALNHLLEQRIECSRNVLGATVMVVPVEIKDQCYFGPLGLINGILIACGAGRIAMVLDEHGEVNDFIPYERAAEYGSE